MWSSAQVHPGTIGNNGGQPCRQLRLSLELVQMLVSGQERIRNCMICHSDVALQWITGQSRQPFSGALRYQYREAAYGK